MNRRELRTIRILLAIVVILLTLYLGHPFGIGAPEQRTVAVQYHGYIERE